MLRTNVVSANAASPSGAGSAMKPPGGVAGSGEVERESLRFPGAWVMGPPLKASGTVLTLGTALCLGERRGAVVRQPVAKRRCGGRHTAVNGGSGAPNGRGVGPSWAEAATVDVEL